MSLNRFRAPEARVRTQSAHARRRVANAAVETLESRQLMSSGAVGSDGVLEVDGHRGNSALLVRRSGDSLQVVDARKGKVLASAPLAGLQGLELDAGRRDVTVDLSAGGTFSLPRGIELEGQGSKSGVSVIGTPGDDLFELSAHRLRVNELEIRLDGGQRDDDGDDDHDDDGENRPAAFRVTLQGRAGDDTYRLDRLDGVTIADSAGVDTLDLSPSPRAVRVRLPGGLEDLVGSRFADQLTGNAAANVIDGGAGNDALTGQGGPDTFVLAPGEGTDTVKDYLDGTDKLKLDEGLNFAELSVVQVGGDTVVSVEQPTLLGFASLPAETYAAGPTSGQFITGANGVTAPFADQPVQGFSAVRRNADGTYWVMSDNGYGAKNNSADFLLRLHRIDPDFRTVEGGAATVKVLEQITLSDPDRKIPFAIVADQQFYPNGNNDIPVDPSIKAGRLLTGADFDLESFRVLPDGTIYFGDEFGPFLIHTDARGRVLEAPVALPGVKSPQNPTLAPGEVANLPASRGFEGMALNTSGTKLYPSLEGALTTDPDQRRRLIYEFDLATRQYTPNQFTYRMEQPGHAIGDLTAINDREFLIIERDNNQGAAAEFKKIFRINLDQAGPDGFLVKQEVVDLLDVADPNDLDANGSGQFTFPFQTIEDVEIIDPWTIGVLDDNNFPFSSGRTPGKPDNNEFILIGLARPLNVPGGPGLPTRAGTSSMVLKNAFADRFTIADTVSTAPRPLVIGHRGASGYRPEHTIEAYTLAIEQGANFIEPDLVITKDGVLIARHEPVLAVVNPTTGAIIERTTDVNDRPEFANRRTTKNLDGVQVTGWFAEDFTLAEIKQLRAVERLPFRNHAFDGQFQIPTFQEVVDLAQAKGAQLGRTIGIYPETKHPTYFDAMGKSLEEPLAAILRAEDLDDADDAVFIQSFEVSNLQELNTMVQTPIAQLVNSGGQPYDFTVKGDPRTYADLAKPAGLAFIASYADGIGANKRLIVPATAADLLPPTTLIDDAHAAGLIVHAWTMRNESPQFLHPDYNGDPAAEYEQFFALGLDGLFSDFPDTAHAVAKRLYPFTPPDFLNGVGLAE